MTQSKKDLIKMIVWVSICMLAILAIATYSHCTHQDEKESTECQVNEARMKAKSTPPTGCHCRKHPLVRKNRTTARKEASNEHQRQH